MEMLDVLTKASDAAQIALAEAEVSLLEANARQQSASETAHKLSSAVAALRGEPPPASPKAVTVEEAPRTKDVTSVVEHVVSISEDEERKEYERERKRKQRMRQKEIDAQNPYSQMPCTGCGKKGGMSQQIVQAPSGAALSMLICGNCGNQLMT
jgi:hypothetical protein